MKKRMQFVLHFFLSCDIMIIVESTEYWKGRKLMKKNIGKRASGVLLSTLAIVMPFMVKVENVSAKETHTNFYFFSDSFTITENTTQDSLITSVNDSSNTTNDYAYDIPTNAEIIDEGWVNLAESGDESGHSTSEWGVRKFWQMYQGSYRQLTGSQKNGVYTPEGDDLYHYQLHGGWSSGGRDFDVDRQLNVTSASLNDLVDASVLPQVADSTSVDIDRQARLISVTIERTISASSPNIDAWQTPIQLTNADDVTADWVLVPALYYLTYEIPDEEVPLFAITQFYYDNNTGEEIQASKVMGTNYENGKTYSIACPATVGSYRLVSNANTSVTINNADGESKCYYELTSTPVDDEIQENPTTSDIPIYIVWAIGAGALGYSVYYFNKYYRKNKEM